MTDLLPCPPGCRCSLHDTPPPAVAFLTPLDSGEQFDGASVRVPILDGPLHTVEGDDLPPLHAGDPRFGTGITVATFPRYTEEQIAMLRKSADGRVLLDEWNRGR